ncbi:MAG: DMT family transporter [Rectinema sp.]
MAGTGATEEQGRGIAAMAACAFFWSLAGVFIKLVDWNPFAIAGARSLIASLFLFACVRKPKFSFRPAQIGAALAYAATMLLFVFANKRTSSANAILLQYGAPIYVALMSSFMLKERPKAEAWAALAAVVVGMGLFFKDGLGGGSLVGDIAATLAGVTFALHIVLMRKQKDGSPLESLLLGHIATAIVAIGIAFFLPAPVFTGKAIVAMFGLGVVQIGMAGLFFAYGIKRVTALQGILIAVIEPVLNPVWVYLATGEKPTAAAVAGGGIIVTAVLVSSVISVHRARTRKTTQ